jgi:hypothetical protein
MKTESGKQKAERGGVWGSLLWMDFRKLALTPWEREKVSQRSSGRTRSVVVRLNAVLPLPGGEGRGEGGRSTIFRRAISPQRFSISPRQRDAGGTL